VSLRYWLGALMLCWLFLPQSAQALSCSATSPGTQTFSGVSPVAGASYSTTGTIAVTCSVGILEGLVTGSVVRACLSISGASGATPRTLTNGSNTLQYNLYSDSAHTQVFGSTSSAPPAPVAIDFNLGLIGILLGGSATINVPLYGLLTSQTTTPAGTYTQNFSAANTSVNYIIYTGTPPTCSGAWTSGGNFAFTVNAGVINDCNISASGITFGPSGVLTAALFANGAVTAQCTPSDSYSIALSAGTTAGASLSDRRMVGMTSSAIVHYQLYTSGSYATIWGDGVTGSTVGGTGNGSNQVYQVFGQVAAQATPKPDTYNDTVTATITY
jgi:spore coat protein U-like protein